VSVIPDGAPRATAQRDDPGPIDSGGFGFAAMCSWVPGSVARDNRCAMAWGDGPGMTSI
jgi:hypothetical protein